MISPIQLVREGIRAVRAVRYAVGIGAVVTVAWIVLSFGIDARTAFVGAVVMLVLMGVLAVFEGMTKLPGPILVRPAVLFTWFALASFIAASLLLQSSVFFGKPLDLQYLLDKHWQPQSGSSAATQSSQDPADEFIYDSVNPVTKLPYSETLTFETSKRDGSALTGVRRGDGEEFIHTQAFPGPVTSVKCELPAPPHGAFAHVESCVPRGNTVRIEGWKNGDVATVTFTTYYLMPRKKFNPIPWLLLSAVVAACLAVIAWRFYRRYRSLAKAE